MIYMSGHPRDHQRVPSGVEGPGVSRSVFNMHDRAFSQFLLSLNHPENVERSDLEQQQNYSGSRGRRWHRRLLRRGAGTGRK